MGIAVQNIVQASALDRNDNTYPAIPSLGAGYIPLPSNGDGGGAGIDQGATCVGFTNGGNAVLANTHYTTLVALSSPIDLSAADSAAWLYMRNTSSSPTFNHLSGDSDAVQIICASGVGTANLGIYDFSGSTGITSGSFHEMKIQGTPDSTIGTYDNTNITAIIFALKTDNSPSAFGYQWGIDQMLYHSGPVRFINDASPGTVSLDDYYQYFLATSGNAEHMLNTFDRAAFAYEIAFPIDFQCDELVTGSSALGIGPKPDNNIGWKNTPAGYSQILMTPQSGATQSLVNTTFNSDSGDIPITLDASAAGASITIAPFLAAGVSSFTVSGNVTIQGGAITSPDSVILSGGLLQLGIDDSLDPVQLTSAISTGSSIIITNPQSAASLRLSIPPADYSGIAFNVPTSDVIIEPLIAGTYDLTSLSSAGLVTFDNDVATTVDAVITHSPALSAQAASPTAGSGMIDLEMPPVVYSATTEGLRANSRLQIINETGKLSDAWITATAYSVGDKAIRTTGVGIELISGLYFVVQIAGTSGGVEPTWDLTPGNTTIDGGVTWVTRAVSFVNDVQAGELSTTYTDNIEFSNGDVARVRATFASGIDYELPFESRVVVNNGIGAVINQEPWIPVEQIGIDGSTVTEFTTDFVNVQVDVDDPDGRTQKNRVVAWHAFQIYDSGIALDVFVGTITVIDQFNYRIERDLTTLSFQVPIGATSANVVFDDDVNYMFTSDGSSLIAETQPGIQFSNGRVNVASDQFKDITARFDLDTDNPNTYAKNSSSITNGRFSLDEVDISPTEFQVIRTDAP